MMKEVKAFIKPIRVQKVVEALRAQGFESITLMDGEGTGAFKSESAAPSLKYHFTDSKVVKLELVCQNEEAEQEISLISESARTPNPADGIIYLSEVEDAFRVKTGNSIKV